MPFRMKLPRHAEIWLPGYVADRWRRWLGAPRSGRPRRLWVAITDHYEPFWRNTDEALAEQRVALWRKQWPEIAARHQDSYGRPPRYCFFYAEEEYRPHLLDRLAEMTRAGLGEVEIHLHHNRDSEQAFVDRVGRFRDLLHERHGLLRRSGGRIVFGFIHGNWALDNSMGGRWCGLNNEITLLRELGCYADFTMPSGASVTQARMVNRIYWAVDDPERPKSYDTGVPVETGQPGCGDLLIIPGPLGLRWAGHFRPRLESGELSARDPVTAPRVKRWIELGPRIGDQVFLKLYAHGAQEDASAYLLGGGLDRIFQLLQAECRRRGMYLSYATAWEMRQAVEAASRQPA